jgi:hypothetical protein
MIKKYFLSCLCFVIFSPLMSQKSEDILRFEQITNLDMGLRDQGILLQADYQHIHRLNPENRFRMGYGLAIMGFRSLTDIDYYTKDASEDLTLGSDTLQVENPRSAALNLFVLLNYAPNDRVDFGFSIDLLGVGWGRSQAAVFSTGPDDPSPEGTTAVPVTFNSSIFGSGSWRSQFEVRYWLYDRWAVHTGFNYWLSAYEVNENLSLQENNFNQGLFFFKLGLSFRWKDMRPREVELE